MSIVLVGSTSGSITLQEPAVAGTTVLDLPATSGTLITTGSTGQVIPRAALPTGSILQVQSTNTSSTTTVNTFTPTDVTGMSVNITPTSSSSKILIIVSVPTSATSVAWFNLVRNGTSIGVGTGGTYNSTFITSCIGNSNYMLTPTFNYLDSPATTSAITYKLQLFSDADASVNKRVPNSTFATTSTITVMEIAA